MTQLHISIVAEEIAKLGPVTVTNSLLTSWLVVGGLCFFGYRAGKGLQLKPGLKQLLWEVPIEALYSLTKNVAGATKAIAFFPFIATFFLFILLSNWSGLIPGVGTVKFNHVPLLRAPSADLNMTLALALSSVGLIQYFGFKSLGAGYLNKFFNFKNPIFTFVGILELISELAKVISFAFRLFGNIFAGEVLLAVTAFLIPVVVPIPFYGLEVFVGFIQALVFSMLTLVFLNMATVRAEH